MGGGASKWIGVTVRVAAAAWRGGQGAEGGVRANGARRACGRLALTKPEVRLLWRPRIAARVRMARP